MGGGPQDVIQESTCSVWRGPRSPEVTGQGGGGVALEQPKWERPEYQHGSWGDPGPQTRESQRHRKGVGGGAC